MEKKKTTNGIYNKGYTCKSYIWRVNFVTQCDINIYYLSFGFNAKKQQEEAKSTKNYINKNTNFYLWFFVHFSITLCRRFYH